jgi:adenylate cyclase
MTLLGKRERTKAVSERRLLESWKAIAAYLGRTEKTCRNWEHELGLPVHRLEDSARARVFAYADELDRWREEKLQAGAFQMAEGRAAAARKARSWVIPGAALAVIALVSAFLIWRDRPRGETTALQATKGIAVLPFVDLSPDKSQEHIGDGISDILINTLNRVEGLRVPARTSAFYFKGKDVTPAEIGRRLKVEWLLEGSVQVSENRVRVVASLLRAADGTTVWTDRYDRDQFDIFAVEDDIARRVVDNLKLKIMRERGAPLIRIGTQNVEAYNLFLKGQSYSAKGRMLYKQAIDCYEKAIAKDPGFAEPYGRISRIYFSSWAAGFRKREEAGPKAREMALKALSIDPDNCVALATMALLKLTYDWDFAGAEEAIRKAIRINPADPGLHRTCACVLTDLGRHDEAIKEALIAVELDPLSSSCWNALAMWAYFPTEKKDLAVEALKKALELDPYSVDTLINLLCVDLAIGRSDDARTVNARKREILDTSKNPEENDQYFAFIYACAGDPAAARRIADANTGSFVKNPFFRAWFHAVLGEKDEAFAWLEKMYQERNYMLHNLKVAPEFEPLRSDPRFNDLLRRIGLEK